MLNAFELANWHVGRALFTDKYILINFNGVVSNVNTELWWFNIFDRFSLVRAIRLFEILYQRFWLPYCSVLYESIEHANDTDVHFGIKIYFESNARESLDCALFCCKARRKRLEHLRSVYAWTDAHTHTHTHTHIYIYIYVICTMENGLPFSTLYSRPDAFRHLPSSGALTCNCYRVVIG